MTTESASGSAGENGGGGRKPRPEAKGIGNKFLIIIKYFILNILQNTRNKNRQNIPIPVDQSNCIAQALLD